MRCDMSLLCVYCENSGIDRFATSNKWRSRVKQSGQTQNRIALLMGIKPSRLSELLNGRRTWTEAMALRLSKAIKRALNGGKRC